MERKQLDAVLARFAGLRVCVIGDFCLDVYATTELRGVSPEKTVLRVLERKTTYAAGAAANVAANFAALGAEVSACGVIGADEAGAQLRRELREFGVDTEFLLESPEATTTQFVRYVREDDRSGDHLLRLDRERLNPLSPETRQMFHSAIEACCATSDAAFLSDYHEGNVALALIDRTTVELITAQRKSSKPFSVYGSSRQRLNILSGVQSILLNRKEAENFLNAVGIVPSESSTLPCQITKQVGVKCAVVTKGAEGAMACADSGTFSSSGIKVADIKDTCGAGDSFASAFTLAQISGCSLEDSLHLANMAAASVLSISGTVATSLDRIKQLYAAQTGKAVPGGKLTTVDDLRRHLAGELTRKAVVVPGCFDLLDAGQLRFLRAAKALGDILVVVINSDRSTHINKGPGRPKHPEIDRLEVLTSLEFVDHVLVFDELTELTVLKNLIRPGDILAKGAPHHAATVVGARLVDELGGQVVILDKC
jgi:D-beta-D-heptose 7-phosphate kinase / D-beta-D-heptose 1-phosphate adenosyltransferase